MVVMCKNPNVRMSLLVPKELWPTIVARMQCYELEYRSEKELRNDERFVRINDISGKGADIMGFLNNLEMFNTPGEDGNVPKIYILMTAKRGKKYVVKENGEEAGGRSEDGAGVRPGSDSESGGTGDRSGLFTTDNVCGATMSESYNSGDNCD